MVLEPCGFVHFARSGERSECTEVGDHFCIPRADRAQSFFEEVLVHTKGSYARKPFELQKWQRDGIIRPLFGSVVWSDERCEYKRQYEIAWIEIARKNGKTEILAGIMLYLLVSDDEESAEIFGVAKNRDQASLCFDVAAQMVRLSPVLAKRLRVKAHEKRIINDRTNSFYRVIAADAGGALGSNPHGVGADEILAWRDGSMWEALRTGMGSGARKQPLMVAATTAGSDSEGFAGQMHKEMRRVFEDPQRSPHIFVFMLNTPRDADPFAEAVWPYANPALRNEQNPDGFLSIESMRKQAKEAKNSPLALNGWLQFRLNMWVSSSVAWMPMHLWDDSRNVGIQLRSSELLNHFAGRECWFGLDLAARQDLTSMCYLFPSDDGGSVDVLWRFWCPESALAILDERNSKRFSEWATEGWLTVTEGDVLDFQKVYEDIEADARRFAILGGDADKWSSDPVIQEIESRTYVSEVFAYSNDFSHMSDSMHRIFEMVTAGQFRHHGNPLARFCFDACQARVAAYDPDLLRPDKPTRNKDAKRIDAVPAAIMAVNAWHTRGGGYEAYSDGRGVIVL